MHLQRLAEPETRRGPAGISALFRHLGLRAETRRVHPHLFRHTRATEAAKHSWNENRMRMFFGWGQWSQMPNYYTHLSPEVLREQVLADAGWRQAGATSKPATSMSEVVQRFLTALTQIVQGTADKPSFHVEEDQDERGREDRAPTLQVSP